jgi:hypothetical protein
VQDLSSHTMFGREAKERYEAALARHPYRETLVSKQLDAIDASETCEKGAEEKEGEDHLADPLKKKARYPGCGSVISNAFGKVGMPG